MNETMTSNEMAVAIVAVVAVFLTVMVIATVAVWQIFATARARMSVAREEAYRKLAEESVGALDRTAAQIERQTAAVEDLRARTAELERMLKEVE